MKNVFFIITFLLISIFSFAQKATYSPTELKVKSITLNPLEVTGEKAIKGVKVSDIVTIAKDGRMPFVASIAQIQTATDSLVTFDGSIWEKKIGNVSSNGGTAAGTIVKVNNSAYWQRRVDGLVSVKWFGAKGDGVSDDTAPIQTAINSGRNLDFGGKENIYLCNNLTQSTTMQRFYSSGAEIWKNGNGTLITFNANYVTAEGLVFRGQSALYTGANIVANGNHFHLLDCGSTDSQGLAVQAKGSRTVVKGTNVLFYSAQAGVSGYDIEIGNSSTATLYHNLVDIYTGSSNGGIRFINVGGHCLVGGQVGKITVDNSAGLAGTNGGMTTNMRITGNVTINASNSTFTNNQFSDVSITVGTGTSGVVISENNNFSSLCTIINNGNGSNYIGKPLNPGGVISKRFGDDNSLAVMNMTASNGNFSFPQITLNNNKGLRLNNLSGTEGGFISIDASNQMGIANSTTDKVITLSTAGSNSRVQFYVNSNPVFNVLTDRVSIGATTDPVILSGTGTPEGSKTAPVGSIYMRKDGGANTSLYVKESGTGNTGWVAK